ncbi:hypothetical protein BCR34DRAFT_589999 [Clohesyomyces aquaticus]|uniref:DUF1365-domain-containing protein n=1 Tax=Clohesyomyces aquaticus TaxID=1231657 RepID=A0A1Y1ZDL9_9PLEO|nr:hypothetical protein BCR34DRAFT_589999 [Clohesyomyces aquaticus]
MTTTRLSRYGLLACFFLPFLPGVIGLGWLSLPFLGLWAALGGVRYFLKDHKILQDCVIFGVISVQLLRKKLYEHVLVLWKELGRDVHFNSKERTLLLASVIAFATIYAVSALRCCNSSKPDKTINESDITRDQVALPSWLKPLLFPCKTTHARTFPKRHAFAYSYLLYGIPVIPSSAKLNNPEISSRTDKVQGKWWLHVRAEDYLGRGHRELGFFEKLKMTLRDEGVLDSEWSYAYLVTAPRFLGYSFNPVSFWYVYDQSHQLKRMILEVNNTFGERRMYLLDGSSAGTPGTAESEPSEPIASKKHFRDLWSKDFHVSPFNSRKGSYSLKALDPFPFLGSMSESTGPIIDNTITQKSSKDHAKIVARVFSTGEPLDPAALGILGTARFLLAWWWVGLVTFPRILKEAKNLYFKYGLHVWLRPEVLLSSVARLPSGAEEALQDAFESHLKHLVQHAMEPLHVMYITCIPGRPRVELAPNPTTTDETGNVKRLEIRVLSPVFYTRFVHYAHTREALDREGIFTDEKNRTIWISHPELLHSLLPHLKSKSSAENPRSIQRNYFAEKRWTLLRKLRCPPAEPVYPTIPKPLEGEVHDICPRSFSDLDAFVRGAQTDDDAAIYRRTVTKVFLAQRIAFGFVEVLDAIDFLLRTILAYIACRIMADWSVEVQENGIGQRVQVTEGTCIGELKGGRTEICMVIAMGLWPFWKTSPPHFLASSTRQPPLSEVKIVAKSSATVVDTVNFIE